MGAERAQKGKAVQIVPCSGLGKSYGTVAREAAFEVTERLRQGASALMPLSLLVMGDDDARSLVAESHAIAIDGFLFCSGQLGLDPKTGQLVDGVEDQTERALVNLAAVLEAA